MRYRLLCVANAIALLAASCASAESTGPSPDEGPIFGFAADVTGGAGKPECVVTTTADSGRGSLRAVLTDAGPQGCCVAQGGCRVRFAVSGTITLRNPIVLTTPNVTLDGATAPSPGVQITNDWMRVDSENVIVRHMRFRPNDTERYIWAFHVGSDVAGRTPRRVLVDHCSFEWATRATLAIFGYNGVSTRDVTVQNSIVAESLTAKKAGFGALVDGDVAQVSFYRNLFASNPNRNPQITTGRVGGSSGAQLTGTADFQIVQNVVHNFIYGTRAYSASPTWMQRMEFLGNVYACRPSTNCKVPIMVFSGGNECGQRRNEPCWTGPTGFHVADNAVDRHAGLNRRDCDAFSDEDTNAPCGRWTTRDTGAPGKRYWNAGSRFTSTPVAPIAADVLEATVLAHAGATLPCRDTLDARIVAAVKARSGPDAAAGGYVVPPTPLPDPPICEPARP